MLHSSLGRLLCE